MFTGLIEEVGKIITIQKKGNGRIIKVKGHKIFNDLKIDDSVAIEGVCQTVVKIDGDTFEVVAVEETLRKTNFENFKTGKSVNLERAIRLSDRLGGHIVQGHVDTTGEISEIVKEVNNYLVTVSFQHKYRKWVIPVGSICINGISLTVANVEENKLTVAVIPHTWDVTTIGTLKIGDKVNLEFDVLGKYIENMLLNGIVAENYLSTLSKNYSTQTNNSKSNNILNQYYNQPEN